MLNENQLLRQVEDVAADHISIGDFESWFRSHSRDVHKWGSTRMEELVDSIESVFSEYYFADLDDRGFRMELSKALCPFDREYKFASSSGRVDEFTLAVPVEHRKWPAQAASVLQELRWSQESELAA